MAQPKAGSAKTQSEIMREQQQKQKQSFEIGQDLAPGSAKTASEVQREQQQKKQ